jgi:hypothetical protein
MAAVAGVSMNSATLTLTASAGAAAGSAGIVVTAAGDGLASSQSVVLQVQQAPGITLSVSPPAVSVLSLSTASATVTVTPLGGVTVQVGAPGGSVSQYKRHTTGKTAGFKGSGGACSGGTSTCGASISLVSGLPKGFTATWSAPNVTAAGAVAWTLTLAGSPAAVAGAYSLGLAAQVTAMKTGTVYSASQSLPMTVTLTAPALRAGPRTAAASRALGSSANGASTEAVEQGLVPDPR